MSLGIQFKKYESCRGLSLPAIGKWKIEFWLAPAGYEIKEHTHPNEDIELYLIFAHGIYLHRHEKFKILGESFYARLRDFGKHFTIRAGTAHSFRVSRWPFIFMNIEHWHTTPTSASEDFVLTH